MRLPWMYMSGPALVQALATQTPLTLRVICSWRFSGARPGAQVSGKVRVIVLLIGACPWSPPGGAPAAPSEVGATIRMLRVTEAVYEVGCAGGIAHLM